MLEKVRSKEKYNQNKRKIYTIAKKRSKTGNKIESAREEKYGNKTIVLEKHKSLK